VPEPAIRVEGLAKEYHIGRVKARYPTAREAFVQYVAAPFRRAGKLLRGQATGASELDETIWALQDISFNIDHGEVVGIIGRNGAGKSTLLKVLSRITEPTKGFVEIHGRIGSLLEVGTGFHPELTGRENVYLNGAILGMKRYEIDRKFDEIVAFAEVEKFIDTPVKHYSSGMHVRLAFAVAAHLEPEILVVDEVLSVGDLNFQRKCMKKMMQVAGEGRTVVFVSHNMASVQALCTRGILLSEGRIVADTTAMQAVRAYVTRMTDAMVKPLAERTDRRGNGSARFTDSWMEDGAGTRISEIIAGQTVRFCLAYRAQRPLRNVIAAFNLWEDPGDALVNCDTRHSIWNPECAPEEGVFVCEVEQFPLRPGRYTATIFLGAEQKTADAVEGAFVVEVIDGDFHGTGKLAHDGKFLVRQRWNVSADAAVC
jgi:lipopolysaccharide transport system ATP-binding protein